MQPHPIAVIIEDSCIGCTKCIQVCPVDAIVGSAKKMHTVISDKCTGCAACVEICPVTCIDLVSIDSDSNNQPINWVERAKIAEINTQKRLNRLEAIALQKIKEREMATRQKNIKLEIQACLERNKNKKFLNN